MSLLATLVVGVVIAISGLSIMSVVTAVAGAAIAILPKVKSPKTNQEPNRTDAQRRGRLDCIDNQRLIGLKLLCWLTAQS